MFRRHLLIAVIVATLLASASVAPATHADSKTCADLGGHNGILAGEVWSDNFDDETADGWWLYGINHTANPDYLIPGNFSLEDGVLRATGPEWNDASHESHVANGTWSFDVDVQEPEDESHFYVAFILQNFTQRDLDEGRLSPGYALGFYMPDTGQQYISLIRGSHDLSPNALTIDSYYSDSILGWHNIIVTRDPTGQFYVYLDEELILGGRNLDYSTSERFVFTSHANPAIDNITVSDTIDYDKAPPEWEQAPSHQSIVVGTPFSYDLNAIDNSGIDQWWLNNTQSFAISQDGVITNTGDLEVGDYGIRVWVNDTLGNTRSGVFTLTVEPSPASFPTELLLIVLGGTAVVIVALIVWRAGKR